MTAVKTISQLPVATAAANTDNLVLDKDNGDGTFTTSRVTSANLIASSVIPKVIGTKVKLTHALSPYNMNSSDELIVCDTTGGNIVINLIGAALHLLPGVTVVMPLGSGQVLAVAASGNSIVGRPVLAFNNESSVFKSDLVSTFYAT